MKKQSTRLSRTHTLSNLAKACGILCVLGMATPAFSQLELLADVNTEEDRVFNEYSSLTPAGNYMYFVSNNELWKSNGTTKYTVKMKSFASVSNLTMVGSTLYFTADDGSAGQELWKSNGSPRSTVRVKDIKPGEASSSPTHLTSVNGVLFFSAHTDDTGQELWKSDGTEGGTLLVKDISRGSAAPRNFVNFNGTLFFVATSPTGFELWKSDGTAANTVLVKDIVEGTGSSNPARLTVSDNRLYFVAMHPNSGREVWISDGTTTGTMLLKDIRPGSQTSTPENLIHANGKLMFTANDGVHGDELWSSDGTAEGTRLVKDMNPGPLGSNNTNLLYGKRMGHFTNINGFLYFMASKDGTDYFYRSDGTDAGTVIVAEAYGTLYNEPAPEFIYRNGYVYFFNGNPTEPHFYGLYRMPYRGGAITHIKNFEVDQVDWGIPVNNNMTPLNGALFFTAQFSSEYGSSGGYELIRTDGTPEGTVSIHDTYRPTMSSDPREMITVNGRVYSQHYSSLSYTPQLYATDGTPEGTFELRAERYHYESEAVGNRLFFLEDNPDRDVSLWQISVSAGTPASTYVVTSGMLSDEASMPRNLTDVNGVLYYFNGYGQIFRSDGTVSGTRAVAQLDGIRSITNVNGQKFAFASDGTSQLQLWKMSGQTLSKVATWNTAHTTPYTENGTVEINGNLYFLVFTHGQDYQIWRSNGTPGGTYKLFGPDGFQEEPLQPRYGHETLLELNDELYLSNGKALYKANETTYTKIKDLPAIRYYTTFKEKMILFTDDFNQEVYASDGTPEGTTLLLARPVSAYFAVDHAVAGEYLYFNSIDEILYRTDGTPCGTTTIDVGAEKPYALEAIEQDLIFGGYRHETGTELYVYHNVNAIPGNTCEESELVSRSSGDDPSVAKIMSSYPNPFTQSFTLKVDGKEGEVAEVAVYTGSGLPVELLKDVAVNQTHSNIGAQWARGLYIVKVRSRNKVEAFQVLKE